MRHVRRYLPENSSSAFTARRRRIDLAELVNEAWVVAPPYTWNHRRLAEAFEARGLDMPKASLVTLSVHIVRELLANGEYITAFPSSWVRFNALKILPVDLPLRPWPVAILTLKNRTLSPVVERFSGGIADISS
jgi:DNA-binding transcriptional LysR family regulator